MAMKKILIDIPQEAIKSLDDIAERKKLSRAEVIRRAIEIAICAESSSGFKQAFGADFTGDGHVIDTINAVSRVKNMTSL